MSSDPRVKNIQLLIYENRMQENDQGIETIKGVSAASDGLIINIDSSFKKQRDSGDSSCREIVYQKFNS